MITISPSLLAADFLNLQKEIESFEAAKDLWFHLDVMDGHFVPNLTFGHTVLKNLSQVTKHKLDAHLMVSKPEDFIESFSSLGLHNFTFHWEACAHQDSLIAQLKKVFPSVGVSLNPATPIESIPAYIFEKIDLLLIMSVNPGFGGQSFIEGVTEKIEKARAIKKERGLNFHVQVDGGVTNKNSDFLIEAGATNLVAGSYIFGANSSEYLKRIDSLRRA
ncbi:MAG: ribulose-phosphate 3-epimerase [Bacteriovoracaceae bacterium]